MKLKKRFFKCNKLKILLFIFILIIIVLIFIFKYINDKAAPILFNMGEVEVRKFSTIIINDSINKIVSDENIESLFIITKDINNEIKTIDFNPIIVNKILAKITNNIQLNLKYIEQGEIDLINLEEHKLVDYNFDKLKKGIICEIPSGVIFNNVFLNNIGPTIPVKLGLAGDIISHINTNVTSYGINNALIEVSIFLSLSVQVVLPFQTKQIKIETSVPLTLKLIQGSIPNYYLGGINQNSNSLTLPIE